MRRKPNSENSFRQCPAPDLVKSNIQQQQQQQQQQGTRVTGSVEQGTTKSVAKCVIRTDPDVLSEYSEKGMFILYNSEHHFN